MEQTTATDDTAVRETGKARKCIGEMDKGVVYRV